jgi:arylsulfatase A-like enzyme
MADKQRGRWGPVTSLLLVAAMIGSVVLATSDRAGAAETVLATGVADASGAQGPKWRRVDFTVPQSGPSTLRLSWTGAGDLRFTVFNSATGQKLGENLTSANPKSVTLTLQAGVAYYSGLWAASGAGSYSYVLIQGTAPTTTTRPGPTTTTTPPPSGRPNVVVINLDDMRADMLAALPKVRQWLADGGTSFRNGYVSTPSCCPSRASLMSGRYVHNNGQFQQQNLGFDLDLTVQRYLHDAGFLTGHAGKFLHWLDLSVEAPHFDRWTYFKGGYENVFMNFDGTVRRSQGYSTTIVFDRAIEYVNDFESRGDARPFYLHLAPVAPHDPSVAEPRYASATVPAHQPDPSYMEADRADKPPFVRSQNQTPAAAQAKRTAMIRTLYTVDDQVDRLMRHLQATGELANTLVLFTSDNGFLLGEHKTTEKFLPYRKAVEVPFLLRWPGRVAAGAVDDRLVTHVDVLPTILAATGVTQAHATLDGRDLLSGHTRQRALTEYWHDPNNSGTIPTWASIRTTAYQYSEYYDIANPATVTFREYYNLQADPYQLVNLLADGVPTNDPDTAPLSQTLRAARQCAGSSCP